MDPVEHVQMVVTGSIQVGHLEVGHIALVPGHHTRAQLPGKELIDHPDQALVDIGVIEAILLGLVIGRLVGWAPEPLGRTEGVHVVVEGGGDGLLHPVVHDEPLVSAQEQQDMHEDDLLTPVVPVPELQV